MAVSEKPAANIHADLEALVGPAGIVGPDGLEQFVVDFKGTYRTSPAAVVRPASTEEVAAVVSYCHREGIGVVPQGGNTGLCGGSVPLDAGPPSIILSLARLNKIIDVRPERATVTVDAGVTIQAVQEAAAAHQLLFAPDWGARGTAQVGGGIATNAGGLNVLRWGSLRSQILGLEAVLPDGRIWDGLRSLRKDSSGFDCKQLFIGTEGTMGIVTKAVFALHPLPSVHETAFVALASLDQLIPFFSLARAQAKGLVSAFELMPEEGVKRVLASTPSVRRPIDNPSDWYVLIRLSGDTEVSDVLSEVLAAAADQAMITDAAVAATADQDAALWLIRDEIPPMFSFDELGNRHKFDIAIPMDSVVDFMADAATAVDSIVPGTMTFGFGHVGDGNLHFSIYPGAEANVEDYLQRGPQLQAALDDLTWRHEGSISAEHGIGQTMRARLAGQKSEVEVDMMRAVKAALDPTGIMNPGKVIPTETDMATHIG